MFEVSGDAGAGRPTASDRAPVTASVVAAWTAALRDDVDRSATDPERVELLRALEGLGCAVAGAQAVVTADFDASQRAAQAAAGVPAERRGRGVAAQVALARRESPHRGKQHLGLAKVLVAEMPHTLAALRAGRITEWRAMLLARETACLSLERRQRVDRALAGDPEALEGYGERELVGAVRKLAYQLDPQSVVQRRRRAESERRVSLRPAPDVMTHLSALLPVAQGVAVYAALMREADRLRALGDPRSRGQIMADTLIARVTGATVAATSSSSGSPGVPVVPVAVNLLVSDRTLFGGGDEPGHLDGCGEIPADLARELVLAGLDAGAKSWLRRLYAKPTSGELVGMDSRARLFPAALAHLIRLRDRSCRTPWCDAPIRHTDHAEAFADGGPTTATNGQGLCEGCNLAKQAPGWAARPRPGPRHTIETITPTGHRYRSRAPAAPTPYSTAPRHRVDLAFPEFELELEPAA